MLIKIKYLDRIKSGDLSILFRKWQKPRVKEGSLIQTAVGRIEIIDIHEVDMVDMNGSDLEGSLFGSVSDLLEEVGERPGKLYKISVRYHSEDPRIALRNATLISPSEFEQIQAKLHRLDKYSKQGTWTMLVLSTIRDQPGLRAADLAALISKEKSWLKPNVRKLKNLGLTISLGVGYSISPRGNAFLTMVNE